MRTVLLTGTRAPATLDLARRLHAEGVRVVGADSIRFPLGRFSRAFAAHHRVPAPADGRRPFLEAVKRLAEEEGANLLWPTCEEIFHLASAYEELSVHVRLFCEPLATLEALHDKLRFALAAGDSAPESWSPEDAPPDRKLVWKPRYSRFAVHTRIASQPPSTEGWMAQAFVEGEEFSSWALCVRGEVRTLVCYRCPVRSGRGAGCAFEPIWDEEAAVFVREFSERLAFTGSLAFDFIRPATGPLRVIECNPRLTSGLHVLEESVRITDLLERPGVIPPPCRAAQIRLPTCFSSPRHAGRSPDVVSAPGDRGPACGQLLEAAEFALIALRNRISLTAATTRDIEYNGP